MNNYTNYQIRCLISSLKIKILLWCIVLIQYFNIIIRLRNLQIIYFFLNKYHVVYTEGSELIAIAIAMSIYELVDEKSCFWILSLLWRHLRMFNVWIDFYNVVLNPFTCYLRIELISNIEMKWKSQLNICTFSEWIRIL